MRETGERAVSYFWQRLVSLLPECSRGVRDDGTGRERERERGERGR